MDLNNDGHPDILSGSYADRKLPEMAGLYYILWGQEDGTFKKPETLTGTDGKPLIIAPAPDSKDKDQARICTRPTALDFTGDGNLDLVVGNFEGTFYLFKGQGHGKFSPQSTRIEIEGKALNTGSHSDPFFADLDGDGDLDLITGSDAGGIIMVENSAGKGNPIKLHHKITTLLPTVPREADSWIDDPRKPAAATRVSVADLNADGKLDLIFGDMAILVSPSQGTEKEIAKKGWEHFQKERLEISKAMAAAKKKSPEMKALVERSTKNYANKSELTSEKYTGFVWVMYQK